MDTSGIPVLKVSLVDDDPVMRSLIEGLLRSVPGFSLLSSYASAEELFHRLPAQVPDILLVDVLLPRINGIEVVQWVSRWHPSVQSQC